MHDPLGCYAARQFVDGASSHTPFTSLCLDSCLFGTKTPLSHVAAESIVHQVGKSWRYCQGRGHVQRRDMPCWP